MILYKGKVFDSKEQDSLLSSLGNDIIYTISSKKICAEDVISAAEKLRDRILSGEYDKKLSELSLDSPERYLSLAVTMLSRENLENKLKTELGEDYTAEKKTATIGGLKGVTSRVMPLGTILHIAAGNADGLPALSLVEGLLTGNVNILKLPQADNGLSLEIIAELIKNEPKLSEFIYVFDTPSSDIAAIKKMADLSDGIVVWGGESAVSAVRKFAPINTKIIEWGHKLSFAYISGYEDKEKELSGLAEHIALTKQLLCSSCQVIYIDTESMDEVLGFSKEFLPYLETAVKKYAPTDIGSVAEITLKSYSDEIERVLSGEANEFCKKSCSVIPMEDSALELSPMFGNVLIKRLRSDNIIRELRKNRGYLQTVGLICSPEKREKLTDTFAVCGLTRITRAADMSHTFSGEAHDGEYALRRYVRVVDVE